jgi:hypothetical protein
MSGVRLPDVIESGGSRPEGRNTMLWILALPVLAVIAMLAYVLGYRYGKRVGIKIARREYESWREMRYCGTALLHMKEVANGFGTTRERRTTALRLCDDEGERRPGEHPGEPGLSRPTTPRAIGEG